MDFTFRVFGPYDVVLARAALDAIETAFPEAERVLGRLNELSDPGDDPAMVKLLDDVEAETKISKPIENAATNTQEALQFTKEQIKAAAQYNEELAALASKRGKKTAAEQARINELTAQVFSTVSGLVQVNETPPVEEPIGDALKGMSAEDLRVALGVAPEVAPTISADAPTWLLDGEPKADIPQVTNSFEAMTDEALKASFEDYVQNHGGWKWFKNVIDAGGGNMNKIPREVLLRALNNPEAFQPAQ